MALSIPRTPEPNRRPGISYVLTDEGVELPVVDLTHPAFDFDLGEAAIAAHEAAFLREAERRERLPRFLGDLLVRFFLRGSVLAGGLRDAEGGFLSGLHTYLLKIGPDLLGAYAKPIDRRIAAALPAVSVRLRLLDMARLLVEGASQALAARRAPLHLINLGGGPSADGWNAVLLLKRDRPELLDGRAVRIHALDVDAAGPAFGARAVGALREPGAPLHGVDVTVEHTPYDWTRPDDLRDVLAAIEGDTPVVAISSEGALFEYASDEDVAANLEALRALTPADAVFVGSVTGDDEIAMRVHRGSRIRLRPRSAQAFAELSSRTGWRVEREIRRPTCRDVLLLKA